MASDSLVDAARAAIMRFGSESDGLPGIALFTSHHRDELSPEYWEARLGSAHPSRDAILELLEPVDSSIDDEEPDDGVVAIDFTLPGDVTQYVLCVRIDRSGRILSISMES